jgi:hypothetical protein
LRDEFFQRTFSGNNAHRSAMINAGFVLPNDVILMHFHSSKHGSLQVPGLGPDRFPLSSDCFR